MKRVTALSLILAIILGVIPLRSQAFNPNYLISDWDLTDPFDMDLNQIQYFLSRGYLGSYFTEDHTGRVRSAAEIILMAAQNHGINPKFLLVLIQKEQSLVEDDSPTQKQLDWAAGYGVCDSCAMDDPAIQRWKGFGKQINAAAVQFSEGYLTDIQASGTTIGRYGPGVPVQIDGTTVVPENAATAAMYAYTPHLHGNKIFTEIWSRWFSIHHPSGTLLKADNSPNVYLIELGYKRPIANWSTFVSRFDSDLIIEVSATQLANYPDGRPITFPNYSILKDENGVIYLLVNDMLRPIDSMETFYAVGFKEDEIVNIANTDLAFFTIDNPITQASVHPQGNLLQLETTGSIFYVQDGVRHPIFDKAIMEARFPNMKTEPALPIAIEQFKEGSPLLMPDGYLVKSPNEAAVYVVSEGKLRPIASEAVFLSYGWSWDDIINVSADALSFHQLGLPIEETINE
ncbi:MAG: hypothetical protein ABH846_02715 [Patescibacteria group bacterium]